MEFEALIKWLRSSAKDERDNLLSLALEGYKCCLVVDDKYDFRMVFRLVSLWFSLSSGQNIINIILTIIDEDTNKRVMLPRDLRNLRQLELEKSSRRHRGSL